MENSNNNCDNNIYISCAQTASVVKVNGDKSRYYAELAEKFKNEAKGYKDTAQYYAEQNSDVTIEYINTLDSTLRNLINNKQDAGNYALVSSLPTKTSDLTNDSGFITTSSVGNGTITIKQDDVTIGNFTVNQSGNTAINIDLSGKANVTNLHALKSYLDEGELLTDAEGLTNLMNNAHSTFDSSKFTAEGSPTITDNGIASGFSSSNYLTIPYIYSDNVINYVERIKFTTGNDVTTRQAIRGINETANKGVGITVNSGKLNYSVGTGTGWNQTDSNVNLSVDTTYIVEFIQTDSQSTFKLYSEDGTLLDTTETTYTNLLYSQIVLGRSLIWDDSVFSGSIDLKQFSVTVDGISVFSGNITGTDTYTIGGNTVTVPYTLSKTGSKIVDSTYRTQVASVYNAQGYAPYYTLSNTDFTLPQGELYGMMLNQATPHIIETYVNGTSGYVIWSNKLCKQWGKTTTTGVVFAKTYASEPSVILTVIAASAAYRNLSGAPATTGFTIQGIVNSTYPVEWRAVGYLA